MGEPEFVGFLIGTCLMALEDYTKLLLLEFVELSLVSIVPNLI